MKTAKVEEKEAAPVEPETVEVTRMFKPEEGAGAAMLSGTPEEVVRQMVDLFAERRLVR
jgi:alkanesulfonate monooxygenase SsuD/methylene tetrahydromethanopterin reductase-like flavin-dependent oxidoreductase (luciferase family)